MIGKKGFVIALSTLFFIALGVVFMFVVLGAGTAFTLSSIPAPLWIILLLFIVLISLGRKK